MRQKGAPLIITILFILVFITNNVNAQKTPPDTVMLRAENAKMPLVLFSHGTHAKTINCAVCHHKDKDPGRPAKCGTCHLGKEVIKKAPPAKDAFHMKCQTCHKERAAKGVSAPNKCNDCHKK